jgi:hypothetical protein
MALWQINFTVLPYIALAGYPKFKGTHISEFDDSVYWKSHAVASDFFKPIGDFLPQTDWYTKDVILFGNEDNNRLEISIKNDVVQSVSFRIDYRSQYESIITQFIDFFIANDLIVLDEHLQIMRLDFASFNTSIQNSPQVKTYNRLANS